VERRVEPATGNNPGIDWPVERLPLAGLTVPPALEPLAASFDHAVLRALPAAVYTTDAAGRITFFNEAAAEM
jgi:PAS domain-containing protein